MKKRIISFLVAMAVVISSLNVPITSSAATQADGNLLYGMTATVNNAHFNGWYNTYRPISKMTDGNTFVGVGYNAGETYVSPYEANGSAYVNFSFDSVQTINKVIIYFPGYNVVALNNQVRDYVVDVQLANGAWERVAEKHNAERSHWDAYKDTLCFAPVECKNLRITCVSKYEQTSICFYEIEAYNDASLTPDNYTVMDSTDYTENAIALPEVVDLFDGVTFSVNSAYDNWYQTNRPLSKLNDGNNYLGVGYNTSETATIPMDSDGTGYVNANFGTATTVNKVDIAFAGTSADTSANQIRDFAIDVKLQDGTWKRVAEQHMEAWTNWDGKKVVLHFDAVKATDVRITFKSTASVFLYEIDAFHIITQTSAENTEIVNKNYTANAIPAPKYTDLFNGVTFSANSAYDNWYQTNRPLSKLNDGNNYIGVGYNTGETATIPMDSNGTGYVNANFGTATTVNKVDIVFAGTSADPSAIQVRDFAVDVKLQNGKWKRVAEQHMAEWTNWDGKKVVLRFDAVTATDVRITFKSTASVFLYEMDAFNIYTQTSADNTEIESADYTANAIPYPNDEDLFNDATFTANSAYDSWYQTNRPLSKLNDGNNYLGIGYNTTETATLPMENNGTGYVNASFETATSVNKIDISFAGTSADSSAVQVRDFAIDVKLQDGTWKRVAEQHMAEWTNWDGKKVVLRFDAVKATDVRITFKSTASVFLYEIDAYHINTQTSEGNTEIDCKDNTVYAVPFPEFADLFKNVTFSANSAYDNWYQTNRPLSKLNDGNNYLGVGYNTPETATIPMDSNGTGYVNASFETATSVNKIDISFAGTSVDTSAIQVRDFAIDVKLQDGTWKRVAEQHMEAWTNWDGKKVVLRFDAVKVTDVRITFKSTASVFLYEIDAFYINTQTSAENTAMQNGDYTDKAIPKMSYPNLLPTATITANAEHYNGWYDTERLLSNLTDGKTFVGEGFNLGKTAVTPYNLNGEAYINFAFDKVTTVNKMVIYFPGYNAVSVSNQVRDYIVVARSVDGVWTKVAEKHHAERSHWDAYSDTLYFDAIACTDIRIVAVKAYEQSSIGFYEVQAYDINTQTSAVNTPFDSGVTIPQPKSADWVNTQVPALNEYAYSFAVVGDTQIVTKNDVLNETNDLSNMYQYIIDKKEEYKISQVIGLGDIVDTYADGDQKEAEWTVAVDAIKKLDGVLPYTLIPGNHDVNWNYNYRIGNVGKLGYLNQTQIVSKYGKKEAYEAGYEVNSTDAQKEPSASNTAHAFTAGGRNYLILTLEYAAITTPGLMDWANKVVEAHPYHNVIITTHAYLAANGTILDGTQEGSPSSYSGSGSHNNGDYFWDNLISKHDNIVMVLCGHVGVDNIVRSTKVGDKGNTVTQIMINSQDLDAEIGSTGMLAFMYFSEDGKTIQLRQYSTVWDRYYGNESQRTFNIPVIEPIEGDVNADREVNVRDLIRYKKYVLKTDNSVVISKLTSDLNSDSEFDTDDVIILRNLLIGVEYYIDSNPNKSVVYLSKSGLDTWTGTESQPYGTLEKALAAVQDDGVIQIKGIYDLSADFVWEKHNKTVTISGGVLDGTALGNTISLGDHVTFDDITLEFTKNSYLFANGYSLTIKENITMPNRIRVYGGGQAGTTVASTDLELYGGSYEAVFGGSNGGTVTGNTSVVIGGNVNEGISPKHDATDYFVYGGGVVDTVKGKTKVTFGGNAKANYVFGGSYGESAKVETGTEVRIEGGRISGVYGGGNKGGTGKSGTITGGIYVEMSGGTVDQVFGGNEASDLTGDVEVKILGGTVTRRVYGGCYNDWSLSWVSAYSVIGNIRLTLSGQANIDFSYNDADLSVFARSRRNPKSDNEQSQLIFVSGGQERYADRLGAQDSLGKSVMSGVTPYDSCTTQ